MAPPRRPKHTEHDIEYEVVWYPHRDAESLLPGDGRFSTMTLSEPFSRGRRTTPKRSTVFQDRNPHDDF